jgi:ATP-dependent RNA helicase RhlE
MPVDAESYVHRIGRTARAGKDGDAISFCDETEREALSRVQKLIGLKLPVETFVGVAEKSVQDTRPPRPYRDPRAKPKAKPDPRQNSKPNAPVGQKPQQQPKKEDKSKVGYKFRNKK